MAFVLAVVLALVLVLVASSSIWQYLASCCGILEHLVGSGSTWEHLWQLAESGLAGPGSSGHHLAPPGPILHHLAASGTIWAAPESDPSHGAWKPKNNISLQEVTIIDKTC